MLVLALVASDVLTRSIAIAIDAAICVSAAAAFAIVTVRRSRHERPPGAAAPSPRTDGAAWVRMTELILYLSPVLLLTAAFPIATRRIAHVTIGGAHLTAVLLACSLTVPWLSQAVCMPLYRSIGEVIDRASRAEIEQRLCRVWPRTFVQTLPALLIFALSVELVTHWRPQTIGAYLILSIIYIAFSQSLVIGVIGRRRLLWAIGWTAFTATLLVAPALWFMPPLVGLVTQLIPLRRRLPALREPLVLDHRDVARDIVRGFLLGAVLWSDKLLFFDRSGLRMHVTALFLGLLPAVLAYNYYFVRLAPEFDAMVKQMWRAMERDSYHAMSGTSRHMAEVVEHTISRTAAVGAVLSIVLMIVVGAVVPKELPLVATVAVASWLFMMTTVLCYKLDYVGDRLRAQAISAGHLIACVTAFALLPVGITTYVALVAVETVIFTYSLRSCLAVWRTSEYQLFWTHATAW